MARWDCGSQHLNEVKLLWIRTLKLWFCVHFQSALLLGEAALTPSTCFFFFLAGLGPQSGSQQKPAVRSASLTRRSWSWDEHEQQAGFFYKLCYCCT